MKLSEFLKSAQGGQAALCRQIKAHAPDMSRWASGARPVPFDRCVPIEAATGGLVRRWDLRPHDWHVHWPELVGTEGAPVPPATSLPATQETANAQ